jgi:hypothetical protein
MSYYVNLHPSENSDYPLDLELNAGPFEDEDEAKGFADIVNTKYPDPVFVGGGRFQRQIAEVRALHYPDDFWEEIAMVEAGNGS